MSPQERLMKAREQMGHLDKSGYSFDPACLVLAEHFLPSTASERAKYELAQSLQNCAEDFGEMEAAGLEPVADVGQS